MFRGGEGYVAEVGEEIVDCGTQTPGACAANGAGVGELCANVENLYSESSDRRCAASIAPPRLTPGLLLHLLAFSRSSLHSS